MKGRRGNKRGGKVAPPPHGKGKPGRRSFGPAAEAFESPNPAHVKPRRKLPENAAAGRKKIGSPASSKPARKKPERTPKHRRQVNLVHLLLRRREGVTLADLFDLEGYDDLSKSMPKITGAATTHRAKTKGLNGSNRFKLSAVNLAPSPAARKTASRAERRAQVTLAKRFERDRRELAELGVVIERMPGDVEVYRLTRASTLIEHLSLEVEEHLLLDSLLQSYRNDLGGAFGELLLAAAAKLKAGATAAEFIADSDSTRLLRALAPRQADARRLDVCLAAHARRLPVRFRYTSREEIAPRARMVEPWGCTRRGEHCYVVGRDMEKGDVRVFRLSRMKSDPTIAEKARPFTIPVDFQLEEVFGATSPAGGHHAIRSIGIRFDAEVGFIVANDFKGIYPMLEHRDGGVTLTVPSAYPDELWTWLCEFAGHFELFTPEAMTRAFRARLEEALAIYESGGAP